jgi:hypothetical protein
MGWVNNLLEEIEAMWNVAYLIQELLQGFTTIWKTYNALTHHTSIYLLERHINATCGIRQE